MAGKRVYISCASTDTSLLDMLTAALDAWEITYGYLERGELSEGGILPATAQNAIRQAEVFLRVCTAATVSSLSMAQELQFFYTLQVGDRSAGKSERRTLANVILDPGYQREPFDEVTLFIDTAGKSRAYWLDELARPLGVATEARRLSRRSAIVLGVAGGVTVLSAAAAGGFLLRNQIQASSGPGPFAGGNRLSGQLAWSTSVSPDYAAAVKKADGITSSVGVAADGTTLYAFSLDIIRALTPQGNNIWNITTYSDIQLPGVDLFGTTPPPYAGHQVLAFQRTDSQDTVNLTVMDSRTWSTLWQKPAVVGEASVPVGPVTVAKSSLYCLFPFQGDDWALCSFDLHTGTVNWSYSIGLGVPYPAAAYDSGRLYIGSPYYCVCLNAETGTTIWRSDLPTTVVATALVSGGLVLFGGLDGCFYALEATSGKLRWQTSLAAPISAQAVALGNVIYVGDATGYLWALDMASGNVYWRVFAGYDVSRDPGTSNAAILYPPAISRNLVSIVAGDTLSAIDLIHGRVRWRYQTLAANSSQRGFATGPVVLGGYLIVGDAQNNVLAINP